MSAELIAVRACQIRANGGFHPKNEAQVPSPCVSVCTMSADRSHCLGCFRTLDDIRAWAGADSARRRAIWAALLARAGLPIPPELA